MGSISASRFGPGGTNPWDVQICCDTGVGSEVLVYMQGREIKTTFGVTLACTFIPAGAGILVPT